MVSILIDGFAHRLLNNGLVQSTPVVNGKIDESKWEVREDISMNMTGAEMFEVRQTLIRLLSIFPSNRIKIAHAEVVETQSMIADSPRS